MTAFDFAAKLRECESLDNLSPESLARFWNLPAQHFLWASEYSPIQFFRLGDNSETAILLRGAQFFPKNASSKANRIIRSHPAIFPTSDHTQARYQILLEYTLANILGDELGEAVVEPKIPGQTIRVYAHNGDLYCATDVSFDGGNPLVGAGIENSRALGIDYGHQAARIISERYPKVDNLARLGYVAVFVLTLPETSEGYSVDRADMILVDVIDPDHQFVDRNEKERIADDFNLNVVELISRLSFTKTDFKASTFVRECRGLSRQAHQNNIPGYIIKATQDDSFDQLFVKVESASERDRSREVSPSDLAAVVDEISGQYGDEIWESSPHNGEELILDFLGTHHPSVVVQVHQFISSWTSAKAKVGKRMGYD
jgi:hypothetical protein